MTDPPRFTGDDGSAPAELVAALNDLAKDSGNARAVLTTVARSRLLVPVVAVLEQQGVNEKGQPIEKDSSMATVLMERDDGSRALLAFTSIAAMAAWRADARPVPVTGIEAAAAAVAEGASALLVDAAGPVPFAVADADLQAVADAQIVPEDQSDEAAIRSLLRDVLRPMPGLVDAHFHMSAAEIVVTVAPTLSESEYHGLLTKLSSRLQAVPALAAALPAGLRLRVVAPPDKPSDTPSLLHDG